MVLSTPPTLARRRQPDGVGGGRRERSRARRHACPRPCAVSRRRSPGAHRAAQRSHHYRENDAMRHRGSRARVAAAARARGRAGARRASGARRRRPAGRRRSRPALKDGRLPRRGEGALDDAERVAADGATCRSRRRGGVGRQPRAARRPFSPHGARSIRRNLSNRDHHEDPPPPATVRVSAPALPKAGGVKGEAARLPRGGGARG